MHHPNQIALETCVARCAPCSTRRLASWRAARRACRPTDRIARSTGSQSRSVNRIIVGRAPCSTPRRGTWRAARCEPHYTTHIDKHRVRKRLMPYPPCIALHLGTWRAALRACRPACHRRCECAPPWPFEARVRWRSTAPCGAQRSGTWGRPRPAANNTISGRCTGGKSVALKI